MNAKTVAEVARELADRSFDQGVQPAAWKALSAAIEKALREHGDDRLEAAAVRVLASLHMTQEYAQALAADIRAMKRG